MASRRWTLAVRAQEASFGRARPGRCGQPRAGGRAPHLESMPASGAGASSGCQEEATNSPGSAGAEGAAGRTDLPYQGLPASRLSLQSHLWGWPSPPAAAQFLLNREGPIQGRWLRGTPAPAGVFASVLAGGHKPELQSRELALTQAGFELQDF